MRKYTQGKQQNSVDISYNRRISVVWFVEVWTISSTGKLHKDCYWTTRISNKPSDHDPVPENSMVLLFSSSFASECATLLKSYRGRKSSTERVPQFGSRSNSKHEKEKKSFSQIHQTRKVLIVQSPQTINLFLLVKVASKKHRIYFCFFALHSQRWWEELQRRFSTEHGRGCPPEGMGTETVHR